MQRLNFWNRLGVVLTLVWVVSTGIYWGHRVIVCGAELYECSFLAASASGWDAIFWNVAIMLGLSSLGTLGNALFAVLVFPAIVWAASYLAIYTVRWINAGR